MSKRQGGLGKGLGALIPENVEPEKRESIHMLSINEIKPNKKQPRKNFEEDKILQLKQSIEEHGIIQPLVLKKDKNGYIIIAGERRWRAAKEAGIKEVPVVIMDNLEDREVLELSLIENIQREDLNPIEEALAYKSLINDFNLTQQELSHRIGKSRVAITNCMRLLNLDERVQEYIIDKVISEGHGRAILALENSDEQYRISQQIIDEELSVRETERLIKNINENKLKEKKDKVKETNPFYNDLQETLQNYFGTKVILNAKGKDKGKLEIEYYSKEDLNRIIELLKINQ